MIPKLLAGAVLVAAILATAVAPASAHVTTDPGSAPQGGEVTVRFRVPNEVANATVVKVDIAFPTDHPLLGVLAEPVAGWTSTVTEATLNPPVQTDDGPVSQAVSQITWTAAAGGGTPPTQFQEFPVLVQQLPKTVDQVVFKAVQTYSDGSVVRWIDPVVAGQPAPDHPTPILKLTAAGSNTGGTGVTAATSAPAPATKTSDSTARTLGALGAAAGILALIVSVVGLRRRTAAPAPSSPASAAE
ncbi:MAG TPA: YcnI family protein [Acidimicrobiales bacterium]|nr:YcnI family protein [Acidimicrobiales bacterium]